jgi:hypothetical protein
MQGMGIPQAEELLLNDYALTAQEQQHTMEEAETYYPSKRWKRMLLVRDGCNDC